MLRKGLSREPAFSSCLKMFLGSDFEIRMLSRCVDVL